MDSLVPGGTTRLNLLEENKMNQNEITRRLEKLDSCAVSDALDTVTTDGAVSGLQRRSTARRIAGRVQTVKLEREPAENVSRRHLGTAAIESADENTIIVVEQSTGIDCAGWGGVLANAARVKGVRGVIVEGPARDIDECEDIGFPVFSRYVTARTARSRIYEASYGAPIQVGDIQVHPGDYVIADGSGVVFIAAEKIEQVLEIAERIMLKESAMTRDVIGGKPVSGVMGSNYEQMLKNKEKMDD